MKNTVYIFFALFFSVLLLSTSLTNIAYAQVGKGAEIKNIHVINRDTKNQFNVLFDVCAGTQAIRTPKIMINSDVESKKVILSDSIRSKVCQLNTAIITANDKNTIQVKLTNQYPDLSKKIPILEEQINTTKLKIKEKNDELRDITKTKKTSNAEKPLEVSKKIDKITKEISELRKDLKNLRAEYYRIQYLINR